jgi:rhodanese-related sulfurtransferase
VRTKGSIDLYKVYFPPIGASESTIETPPAPPITTTGKEDPAEEEMSKKDFGFQTVSVAQAIEFFNDPMAEIKVYLFVDARDDKHYGEGHIPGAIQADHYQLDLYLDNLIQYAEAAEKIIVYCNGGDCEDSIYMCQDLEGMGISHDIIYLFVGGWEAWTKNDMPIETGGSE